MSQCLRFVVVVVAVVVAAAVVVIVVAVVVVVVVLFCLCRCIVGSRWNSWLNLYLFILIWAPDAPCGEYLPTCSP